MLRNTFIHLPGVGTARERTLWQHGILDWHRFLTAAQCDRLPKGSYRSAVPLVQQSLDAVSDGNASFFHGRLPSRETWRLYPEFADRALFLDIETTGLSPHYDQVTLIGALGGGRLALFVNGINLDQFPAYVAAVPRSWSHSTAANSTCRSCGRIFPRRGWIRPTSTCGLRWPRWATGAG